jgi:hypothetical protein
MEMESYVIMENYLKKITVCRNDLIVRVLEIVEDKRAMFGLEHPKD